MAPTNREGSGPADQSFEQVVAMHYQGLYRFAFSLTRNESEACDLTQQTFYTFASHSASLRDPSKTRSWLFTTLYRDFLKARRRQDRFPHEELTDVEDELPSVEPAVVSRMDWQSLMEAFGEVDEVYQAPLSLFYLQEHSYQEIAEILQVPIGTVMSRIARGRAQLRAILVRRKVGPDEKIIPFPSNEKRGHRG